MHAVFTPYVHKSHEEVFPQSHATFRITTVKTTKSSFEKSREKLLFQIIILIVHFVFNKRLIIVIYLDYRCIINELVYSWLLFNISYLELRKHFNVRRINMGQVLIPLFLQESWRLVIVILIHVIFDWEKYFIVTKRL